MSQWLLRGGALWGVLALLLSGCPSNPGSGEGCVTDADCVLKGEYCRANQCWKHDPCEKDDDCKYKGEVCLDQLCKPDDGTTNPGDGSTKPPATGCESTCVSDAECKECTNGRNSCISGSCVVSERASAYGRCGSAVGIACGDGLVCTGSSSQYCLPECNPAQKRCSDGKSECIDPNGTGRGLCLPDGQADQGQACSPNFSGDKTLDASKFCKDGLYCDSKNTCQKLAYVGKYKACGSGRVCNEGLNCVQVSQESAFCFPSCDLQQQTCEGTSGRCLAVATNKGVCVPKGTKPEFSKCNAPTGDTISGDQLCAEGLSCTVFSKDGICIKAVQQCTATACNDPNDPNAPVRTCIFTGSVGVCPLTCQEGSSTCPNGLACVLTTPGGGETHHVCGL